MTKRQIITIAGRPGSGKSTTAKRVADKLGFEHFSSGDLFRQLAKQQGFDLLQANFQAEKNTAIDNLVDEKLRELGATKEHIIVDSRMAWHWMPFSFKVFLDLDLQIAANRILSAMAERKNANEDIDRNPSNYARTLQKRLDSEVRRYKKLYHVNPYDTSNYDLVIDTSSNQVQQVVELVVEGFHDWLKQ